MSERSEMTKRLTDDQLNTVLGGNIPSGPALTYWDMLKPMAAELLALRADLARVEPDSVLADLLNERARAGALSAECVEAWRQFYLEKAKGRRRLERAGDAGR